MSSTTSKITKLWPTYASVTHWRPKFETTESYDYPLSLLPIGPEELASCSESAKSSLATCLWIQYNRRTIDAEEFIANPAIDWLCREVELPGEMKLALMQVAIDERYHTYFHTLALNEALERSQVKPPFVRSITVRELRQTLKDHEDPWSKNLIQLAYAAVAEVSVNAFLQMLSNSKEIKRSNRELVSKHNADEQLHSSVFVEVVTHLLKTLPSKDSEFLIANVKNASLSFLKHDFSMYESVLSALNLKHQLDRTTTTMTRDMSGVERLIRRLG